MDPVLSHPSDNDALAEFIGRCSRLVCLTGAGLSTESGIPDYRDDNGDWKRSPPVSFRDFADSLATRKRYWARAMVGHRFMMAAKPNDGHLGLARLQAAGRLNTIITQNVDRLHQAAGSVDVIDLHGRIDRVMCMGCGSHSSRRDFQSRLVRENPAWSAIAGSAAPDGDADVEGYDFDQFVIPACEVCGGDLKPDVVFFGETVPTDRVSKAMNRVEQADGLLVVGSSLMVFSGFRFARRAAELDVPLLIVNRGQTRADHLAERRLTQPCGEAIPAAAKTVLEAQARKRKLTQPSTGAPH